MLEYPGWGFWARKITGMLGSPCVASDATALCLGQRILGEDQGGHAYLLSVRGAVHCLTAYFPSGKLATFTSMGA